MPDLLRCSKCKENKPASQFSANKTFSRGYSYQCKPCIAGYDDLEKRRKRQQVYARANPDKIKAHRAIHYQRPGPKCESCGSTINLQKHHPDYSKPTLFITLCSSCHVRLHAQQKEEARRAE